MVVVNCGSGGKVRCDRADLAGSGQRVGRPAGGQSTHTSFPAEGFDCQGSFVLARGGKEAATTVVGRYTVVGTVVGVLYAAGMCEDLWAAVPDFSVQPVLLLSHARSVCSDRAFLG